MNLIVENISHSTFDKIVVKKEAPTVADLKAAISAQTNVPVIQQALVFKEFYLNNEHQLAHYGIKSDSVITLRVKRSKLKEFLTKNIFFVFGGGFLWGLGHYAMQWFVRMFLLDLKGLRKAIK